MRFKILFLSTLLLITLGSLNYSTLYYLGIDVKASIIPNAINLLIVTLVFIIGILTLCLKQHLVNNTTLTVFLTLILFLLFVSLLFNKPIEYFPSALRFLSYYFAATLAYFFLKENGIGALVNLIRWFLIINVFFALFFGYLEVYLGDVQFLNGAYRYSGTFKYHQLGNAMYLVILLMLWFEIYVVPKRSIWSVLVFLLLLNLLLNTHSRMILVVLFLSYCLYYIIKTKSFLKFIKIGVTIIITAFMLYGLIINTQISPRLKTVFLSAKSLNDASTNERINIAVNTYNSMELHEKLWGIGLGGFNNFYENITGKAGVAAHNNYLLFFAEGGIIGLALFLVYQIGIFLAIYRLCRRRFKKFHNIDLQRLLFNSLFVYEIGCFLLNNYYFYCSQLIIWILLGFLIYLEKVNFKIHESNR